MLDDALRSPQGLEKLLESHVIVLSALYQLFKTMGEFTALNSKFTAVNSLKHGISPLQLIQGILEVHSNISQVQTSH